MFRVYSALYTIALLILIIPQYLKRPRGIRKKWLREKMGMLPNLVSPIWVHAVSVGEVNAALPLLRRLREKYPQHPLLLSTITDTGQILAQDKAPEGTTVIYLPFDLVLVLKRALNKARPNLFIVMETELWPNILRLWAKEGIPSLVINGRISEKSAKGYSHILFFMRTVLSCVNAFGMQSETDAERLRQIGADPKKITVTGNFKFDLSLSSESPDWTRLLKGRILVAGSTHRGEEELVLSAFRSNMQRFSGLCLILAPRHPERFREVEEMLRTQDIPFSKRSELALSQEDEITTKRILLLDSIGELSAVYRIAELAIIGKSFTGFGGQNPLEAAYWGKAIICGPHMENFPFIKEFYQKGAAFEVQPEALSEKIGELLLDPEKARHAGAKARELFDRNSGAVVKAVNLVEEIIRR